MLDLGCYASSPFDSSHATKRAKRYDAGLSGCGTVRVDSAWIGGPLHVNSIVEPTYQSDTTGSLGLTVRHDVLNLSDEVRKPRQAYVMPVQSFSATPCRLLW